MLEQVDHASVCKLRHCEASERIQRLVQVERHIESSACSYQELECLLVLPSVGDVTDIAREQGRVFRANPSDGELDWKLAFVCPHRRQLDPLVENRAFTGGQVSLEPAAMSLAKARRDHKGSHLLAEDVLSRVSERLLGRRVELQDATFVVDRDQGVEGRLDHRGL